MVYSRIDYIAMHCFKQKWVFIPPVLTSFRCILRLLASCIHLSSTAAERLKHHLQLALQHLFLFYVECYPILWAYLFLVCIVYLQPTIYVMVHRTIFCLKYNRMYVFLGITNFRPGYERTLYPGLGQPNMEEYIPRNSLISGGNSSRKTIGNIFLCSERKGKVN